MRIERDKSQIFCYLLCSIHILKRNILNKKDVQCLYQSFLFKELFDKTTPIERIKSKKKFGFISVL